MFVSLLAEMYSKVNISPFTYADSMPLLCQTQSSYISHSVFIKYKNQSHRPILSQVSFQQTFEQKRSAHLAELQQKEDEMRQMFVQRVKEKEAELKEAEKEVGVLNDLLLHDN